MSNIDDQISQILKNITTKEIRTRKEIKKRNLDAINDIYNKFLMYPENKNNRDEALEELKDYELVNRNQIQKNDTIIYFRTKWFYNIKSDRGRAVGLLSKNRVSIKSKTLGTYIHLITKYYFRKLTESDLVKISLIEAVFEND